MSPRWRSLNAPKSTPEHTLARKRCDEQQDAVRISANADTGARSGKDAAMQQEQQLLATIVAEHLGGVTTLGCDVRSDADFAKVVEAGLPPDALSTLAKCGVSEKEITTLIINPRTLSHRRAKGQRLSVDESDRAARVARAVALAEQAFANRERPAVGSGSNSTFWAAGARLTRTQAGARLVETELARIAWGVPP